MAEDYLKTGTVLNQNGKQKYVIERPLSYNDLSFTYLAYTDVPDAEDKSKQFVLIRELYVEVFCERKGNSIVLSEQNTEVFGAYIEDFRQRACKLMNISSETRCAGIARIYDCFEENNTCYYAMEYIPGDNLAQKISSKGSMKEKEVKKMALSIAETLSIMNEKGFLCMALTPSNVMFRENGTPVLVNFGLHRFDRQILERKENAPYHISGVYSPHELTSVSDTTPYNVTPAADVYSLGMLMYNALTCNCPPEASETNRTNFLQYSMLNSGVNSRLVDVIVKAVNFCPEERHQSFKEFLSDIHNTEVTPMNVVEKKIVVEKTKKKVSKENSKISKKKYKKTIIIILLGLLLIGVLAGGYIVYPDIVEAVRNYNSSDIYYDYEDEDYEEENLEDSESDGRGEKDSEERKIIGPQPVRNLKHPVRITDPKYVEYERGDIIDDQDEIRTTTTTIGAFDVYTNDEEVREEESTSYSESVNQDEEKIFDVVEQMPSYPGGQEALFRFLNTNIEYPSIAEENGVQGKVYLKFCVEKDGSIGDVQVIKSLDPSCDAEAARVVRQMTKWSPGKQNGKPVRVWYTLSVVFKLM